MAAPLVARPAVASDSPATAPRPGRADRDGVDAEARRFLDASGAPGLAIGLVTPAGRQLLTYGLADPASGRPVSASTLFEVGSISKTFTAALAALAVQRGAMDWRDSPGRHVPEVAGPGTDRLTLRDLATHTTGGMPLQFPDGIADWDATAAWFRRWVPLGTPGAVRSYANPSIGLLGVVAARALGGDFATLVARELLEPLGLRQTRLRIGPDDRACYALGHRTDGTPTRQTDGPLATEAYGVRITVGDLTGWIEAQLGLVRAGRRLQQALRETHRGHVRTGPITQGLIWEWFAPPAPLAQLEAASAPALVFRPNPAEPVRHTPLPPDGAIVAKTGGTAGFGAYVAFSPGRGTGLAILANRSCPIQQRLALAQALRDLLSV